MIDLSNDHYSSDEMLNFFINHKNSNVNFKTALMRDNVFHSNLNCVNTQLECDSSSSIKYSAIFKIVESEEFIEWSTDKIQPLCEISVNGNSFEYPLSPPLRISTRSNEIYSSFIESEIECYDNSSFLRSNSLGEDLTFDKGESYNTIINQIFELADFTNYIIPPISETLSTERTFEEGENLLNIINELLEEVNFYTLYSDIDGNLISSEYIIPSNLDFTMNYSGKNSKLITYPITRVYDTFDKPNRFIGYSSNPDLDTQIRQELTNDFPNSPISTTNIGYTITSSPTSYQNVSDVQSLYDLVYRELTETLLSYETISFDTIVIPGHGVNEILIIDNDKISGLYQEISWKISISDDDKIMSHSMRSIYNE